MHCVWFCKREFLLGRFPIMNPLWSKSMQQYLARLHAYRCNFILQKFNWGQDNFCPYHPHPQQLSFLLHFWPSCSHQNVWSSTQSLKEKWMNLREKTQTWGRVLNWLEGSWWRRSRYIYQYMYMHVHHIDKNTSCRNIKLNYWV